MNKRLAFIVVFISGIAVTALEIASARIAAPFFGSTIYVWGGAIGTVLAALAFGYWVGGRIIDRFQTTAVVTWVLLIASGLVGAIPLIYVPVNNALSNTATTLHTPVGVIVVFSMLILFFLPLVCLGMMSPIVLRLSLKKVEEAGSWSGMLSGGATFGSIIGTFLSAYWMIPIFGTRMTIIISGTVLFFLALLTARVRGRGIALVASLLLLSAGVTTSTHFTPRSNVIWAKESPYQYVQTVEVNGTRYLVHDAALATQSSFRPSDPNGPGPYDIFGMLPYLVQSSSNHRSVLLLGLGGGNMVRTYQRLLNDRFTFDITAVEIDPVVVEAARRYFDLKSSEATIVVDDARHFLRTTKHTYDIVIVDSYTHEMQIPPMLATREFFQEIQQRLSPGGVLGMNAYVTPGSRYYQKLQATVAGVFPDVRDVTFTATAPNHLIIASEAVDLQRLPEQLGPRMTVDVASARERMTRVTPSGDRYTDDRTDLELRVRPFVE